MHDPQRIGVKAPPSQNALGHNAPSIQNALDQPQTKSHPSDGQLGFGLVAFRLGSFWVRFGLGRFVPEAFWIGSVLVLERFDPKPSSMVRSTIHGRLGHRNVAMQLTVSRRDRIAHVTSPHLTSSPQRTTQFAVAVTNHSAHSVKMK